MLCSMVINLLNKGTICLTQKKKEKMKLCFHVLWLRWISHVEWKTALTEEKQRKRLLRDEPAPFTCPPTSPPPLSLIFSLFLQPQFLICYSTWAYPCTAALEHAGTDKPAVMKMNVPTWSPIEFHYEVYLLGGRTPGSGMSFTWLSSDVQGRKLQRRLI